MIIGVKETGDKEIRQMKDQNRHITDEQLARYLSGRATPEEEAAVLDYLSESDEHLDDFLAMSAAVEVNKAGEHKRHIRPLWPSLSIAASVILFLCIGLPFLQQSPSGSSSGSTLSVDNAPSYATTDTIIDLDCEE